MRSDSTSYNDRLVKLDLLPITYRHEIMDLIFYYKCRFGHFDFPIYEFVQPRALSRSTRNSSAFDLLIPKCRTKLFRTSYFNRLPKLWNNLPVYLRSCNSLKQFKTHLIAYYTNVLKTAFDINTFNTWKSICLKSCSSRNILTTKACCY